MRSGQSLLSQGSRALYAYDPASGAELWRVEERSSYSGATRPVTGHGLGVLAQRLCERQVLAIRPGKQGEVLDAKAPSPAGMQLQVVWKTKQQRAEEAVPAAPWEICSTPLRTTASPPAGRR